MYLALFAGGRIMRSSVLKATGMYPQRDGLSHDDVVRMGTNFFTFDVPDEDLLRLTYKKRLRVGDKKWFDGRTKVGNH